MNEPLTSNPQFTRYWTEGPLHDWDSRDVVVGRFPCDYVGPLVRLDEVLEYLKRPAPETDAGYTAGNRYCAQCARELAPEKNNEGQK